MVLAPDPVELAGSWRITRLITNALTGSVAHMNGVLEITEVDSRCFRWTETGELLIGDATLPVWRRYLLQDQDGWKLTFENSDLFHDWRPVDDARHLCGEDLYRGAYRFDGLPHRWTVDWWVRGPRKDMHLHTRLERPTLA